MVISDIANETTKGGTYILLIKRGMWLTYDSKNDTKIKKKK
jgi:uncharacterized protein with PhoU and TrkA domain